MLKCDRVELCRNLLLDEGYRAAIDDDGDLIFKSEGRSFFIILDDDEVFFRIVMPNIWQLESAGERANAVRAAHDVVKELKVAKVFCVENNVWCSAELFFGEVNHLKPVLNRLILVVNQAATRFARKMQA